LAHRRGRIRKDESELKNKFLKKKKVDPKAYFHNPEHFVAKFRKEERDDKRVKRHLIKFGATPNYFAEDQHHKVALVIRFRG
jgi:hypothetical protein